MIQHTSHIYMLRELSTFRNSFLDIIRSKIPTTQPPPKLKESPPIFRGYPHPRCVHHPLINCHTVVPQHDHQERLLCPDPCLFPIDHVKGRRPLCPPCRRLLLPPIVDLSAAQSSEVPPRRIGAILLRRFEFAARCLSST